MSWVATAIVGGAIIGGGASIWAAGKSADAVGDAAAKSSDTQLMIYNDQKRRWEPYETVGKEALPGLKGFDAAHPYPSFEETVSQPMEGWDYTQSPAYKAKYTLGMEELNKQLQARGLAPSGVGATRAADLSRRLTAEDYAKERDYRRGNLTDIYNSRLAANQDKYSKILDMIKIGTGASSSAGAAGNQYATAVGKNTMAAGEADADYYSGLAGMPLQIANTGLKAYDAGKKGGWWEDGSVNQAGLNAADIAYNPSMTPDTGALYGL
jgi:hypothetical protein